MKPVEVIIICVVICLVITQLACDDRGKIIIDRTPASQPIFHITSGPTTVPEVHIIEPSERATPSQKDIEQCIGSSLLGIASQYKIDTKQMRNPDSGSGVVVVNSQSGKLRLIIRNGILESVRKMKADTSQPTTTITPTSAQSLSPR
jgi:hypothetical protein